MQQPPQTLARPREADGASWIHESLARGPQVRSSPQVRSGQSSSDAGADIWRLPSAKLLSTSERMPAFMAPADMHLIEMPAVTWELAVSAACAGAAGPLSPADEPRQWKLLPHAVCAGHLPPASGPRRHYFAARLPEAEGELSATYRLAFTEMDLTRSCAKAGAVLEHDAAVIPCHFRPWPALFKIGIALRAAPAEPFNVFGCRPWPAMSLTGIGSNLLHHLHNESCTHKYSVETFAKLVCHRGMSSFSGPRSRTGAFQNCSAACAC